MPRLDARRIGAWRDLQSIVGQIERDLTDELRTEWDISLGWFDVLASLQRLGGSARPQDVARDLGLPPSSVSRRLDRLEEEGWVARHRPPGDADRRAVTVELTRSGRRLWREMNITYRRALQARFGVRLDDERVRQLCAILDLLAARPPAGDGATPPKLSR